MAYDSAAFKDRWRTDPVFRAKKLELSSKWHKARSIEQRAKDAISQKEWASRESSKPKMREAQRRYKQKNRALIAIKRAIRRAKEYGFPCDEIHLRDLVASRPKKCQCCDVNFSFEIIAKRGQPLDSALSVDKVNPALGYVDGNVGIICWRCNSLKKNASIKEVEMILNYMKSFAA